jgi:hypothetical protein
VATGDGLSGGGDLTADRTLSVDATVVRTSGDQTISGNITATTFKSTTTTGTAPLDVSSTTVVANLNADLLDGLHAATTNSPSTVVARDASGNFAAGTITATLEGNASTASAWETARTLTIGSSAKGVDGAADVSWSLAEIGAVDKAGDSMTGFLTLHADPTIALHAASKQYVDGVIAANDALVFKGTLGVGGTFTTLPLTHDVGWTIRVITAGTYAGQNAEVGDMYVSLVARAGSGNVDADWTLLQTNIDGAVIGPASSSDNHIALFNGPTGKVIKSAGVGLGSGVLTVSTSGTGLSGSGTFGANQATDATVTISSNATNLNTASTIVARDASGNFAAGTITANLIGNVTGNLTGTASAIADNTVTSAKIVDDSIVNADINASAAIALTKLGTGALPTGITVTSTNIVDGSIVNADINASAAIALSKLATGALPTGITVASANIVDGSIVNADINASAAIADTKLATISTAGKVSNSATTATNLNTASTIVARDASGNFAAGTITANLIGNVTGNLTGTASAIDDNTVTSAKIVDGSIVNADINASAAIALTKLGTGALPTGITVTSTNIVDGSIVNADINASAAIALSKLATGALPTGITVASANIVDGSIVNADINASAAIADTKLATISTAGKVSNSATTATNLNTANAIVARDASGNFAAGTITADLVGNVTGTAAVTIAAGGTNQNITLTPTGTGTVNAPTFNATSTTNGGFQGIATDTAALPSHTWTGDLTTGMYRPGAGIVGFTTAGAERVRITSGATTILGNLVLGTQTNKATITYPTNTARTYSLPDAGANADFVMTAGAQTVAGTKTFSSQLVSTAANNTASGGGQIYLNGATGNRIEMNTNGVANPTSTTRSLGTKIVLFPGVSASDVDYALGIASSTLWFSVPNSARFFRWYGGTTEVGTLSGSGALTTTGTITAPTFNATSTTNGGFQGIATDSATLPSFTWTADLNTGMYRPADDTIGLTVGGAERMRVVTTGIHMPSTTALAIGETNSQSTLRGPILTFGTITPGSGYTPGTYTVTLTGTFGSGAIASVTVNSSGQVSAVSLDREGIRYAAAEVVTSTAVPGGTGWSVVVSAVRQACFYARMASPRMRLLNSSTSVSAGTEIASVLFGTSDTTTGGQGDKVRLVAEAEGTSGGGRLLIFTAANGAEPVETARFQSNGMTLAVPLLTSQTSTSVFNTTATTITAFGAATAMTLGGTPTGNVTHNYSTNATAIGSTKTLNIGTGGVAGSTTNVNIAPTDSTGLTRIGNSLNVRGRLQTSSNTSTVSWTTSGISFDSSAATFTDTSSAEGATVATRTANSFNRPSFASTNAITLTNASTVYIAAAPLAATNTTITNTHAVDIASGRVYLRGAGSATIPALAIRNLDSGLYSPGTDIVGVTTAGVERMRIQSTGMTTTGTITAPTFNATSTTNGGFQGIATDTAALPSHTWTGDLTTGMYRPGAGIVGVTCTGAERFRVEANTIAYNQIDPLSITGGGYTDHRSHQRRNYSKKRCYCNRFDPPDGSKFTGGDHRKLCKHRLRVVSD